MDPRICGRLAVTGGVASVAELGGLGVSRHVVDDAVRDGALVRLRRGVVVDGPVWRAAPSWERHAIRARAVLRCLGPTWRSVTTSPCRCWVSPSTAATSECTSCVGSVRVVDGPLACLQDALPEALETGRFGRGAAHDRIVAAIADARVESAGESRSRWLFRVVGLPDPELQVWIRGDDGFAARVDFLFRAQRTIVEFDGMAKYATTQDLRAEKIREDRLRELGYEVVRIVWAELTRPAELHPRITAAFARSARRVA